MGAGKVKVNTSVPVFLWKLWVLLSDDKNDAYVRWTENGDSFVVVDVLNFSKQILPQYFKHSNFASFVRQLNLYGFRKVIDIQQGILSSTEMERFEFQHSLFKRGRQDLIEQIRRKLGGNSNKIKVENLQNTCHQVQTVADSHREISSQLSILKDQNERIWSELLMLRDQHDRQSKVLDRLINFFASVFRPYNSGLSNMLISNFLQNGDNSSSYNMSTITNSSTDNDKNNNVDVGDTLNTSIVPLENLSNFNFNNNALAALTFDIPSSEHHQQPLKAHPSQQNDKNCLVDDPLTTLSSGDNSFQELPLQVSSIPINSDIFGANDSKPLCATDLNNQANTSSYKPAMSHSLSDNFLFQSNLNNIVNNLQSINSFTTNPQDNLLYGSQCFPMQSIKRPSTAVACTSNNENDIVNKFQYLADDCRAVDQELSTIQEYLKLQNIEGLQMKNEDGGDQL